MELNDRKISNENSDTEDDDNVKKSETNNNVINSETNSSETCDDVTNSENNDILNITNNSSIPKTANMLAKIVLSNKVTKNAVTNYVEKNPKKAAVDMVKLYNLFSKNKKDKLTEDEINNKIQATINMINEMMPIFMNYMASHYPQDKQVNFEINNTVECNGRTIKYHVIISE